MNLKSKIILKTNSIQNATVLYRLIIHFFIFCTLERKKSKCDICYANKPLDIFIGDDI